MSLLPRNLPGSVRDVLVQSIRRSPAGYPNAHGGDSLRRFVLKRNAFVGTMDAQDMVTKPSPSLRRISAEISPNGSQEESPKSRLERSSAPIRRSRSVQHLSAVADSSVEETSEDQLEDIWFDQVMDSLYLEDSLSDTFVDGEKNGATSRIHPLPASDTVLHSAATSV